MENSLDDEIYNSLIDYYQPQAATDWVIFQEALESSLLDRIKWLYLGTLGHTLNQALAEVNSLEIYPGTLQDFFTAKPGFLIKDGDYSTIQTSIDLAEIMVLNDELALFSLDGKEYVLFCDEALVGYYRSLNN